MTSVSYIQRPNRPLYVYAIVYLAFLYIPVLFLPVFSFNDATFIAFPLRGFTTKWYTSMLNNGPMHAALWNSVKVGLATALFATILGILGAKAVTRYRMPGQKPVIAVIMLPLVIPGIILGVALLVVVNKIFQLDLSLFTVALGHVLISVPFAMATLISRFEGFDKSMEEASADLGENAWWTFWRVTFKWCSPACFRASCCALPYPLMNSLWRSSSLVPSPRYPYSCTASCVFRQSCPEF